MSSFFIFVILIGWLFSYAYDAQIILYIAVIFALAMNVTSYWYSDKIALKLTNAHPANKKDHFELFTTVENLAITAGLPMPRVYIIPDRAPNAFATGRDPEHAVVAVTTGLLEILEKNELEGVIAHELSHIGNRDMLVSTVAVVLVGFISILSDIFLRMTIFGGGGRDRNNGGAAVVIIAIVAAILAPLAASLMHLAISRKREFLADASGALLTRYPEGLANALKKISAYSAPMKRANNTTAHLFISNPFGPGGRKQFFTRIFSTHPPTHERVQALLGGK
ncbi:zinc metalloprotease HtpX [bacterium]|nr:zinc metalloprotease HtpX [bacterium]|tara:strand:- start:18099 stop:18938 length:840 start_codon:yes stop_codon:yes gene_type:complete